VVEFQVLRHIDVGNLLLPQKLLGKIIKITSTCPLRLYQRLHTLEGVEVEARIYDPVYLNLEEQGDKPTSSNLNDWPIVVHSRTRCDSSHWQFCSDLFPLETLADVVIPSQQQPLVVRPQVYRLFHLSRELTDERACAVILWSPPKGIPLTCIANVAPRLQRSNLFNDVIVAFRTLLHHCINVDSFVDCITVGNDESLGLSGWEGFYVDEVDNDVELDEWRPHVDREVKGLEQDLERIGLTRKTENTC
jgi:hypothetical protein